MSYTLTKEVPTQELVLQQTAFATKLTVTSSDAVAYPPKVFVMRQPPEGDPVFSCIASPVDLIDYPVDEPAPPDEGVQRPYFRVAELTIVSRAPTRLAEFIAKTEEELEVLEQNLAALLTLST